MHGKTSHNLFVAVWISDRSLHIWNLYFKWLQTEPALFQMLYSPKFPPISLFNNHPRPNTIYNHLIHIRVKPLQVSVVKNVFRNHYPNMQEIQNSDIQK